MHWPSPSATRITRKAGRGEISDNRHKRFFWIHPYTRTLYWSASDPSRAGRQELKAKSVAIEAVRVVSDTNANPPGLYNKSIVMVTPSRSIKVTAPTQQRHETWFNALSYLLLRQTASHAAGTASTTRTSRTMYSNYAPSLHRDISSDRSRTNTLFSQAQAAGYTVEDVHEFTPGAAHSSRMYAQSMSRRSRSSLAASNSSSVAASPMAKRALLRPVEGEIDADGFRKPARPNSIAASARSRSSTRLSSFTSRFAVPFLPRATPATEPPVIDKGKGRAVEENHDQAHGEGTENVSSGVMMENVRACCDGMCFSLLVCELMLT